jgi:hypothetical protein
VVRPHAPGLHNNKWHVLYQAERRARGYIRHLRNGNEFNGRETKTRSVLFARLLFDVHVFELAGFEDLAAILALDELSIFIAAHNLHAKMLARLRRGALRSGGRLGRHKPTLHPAHMSGCNFLGDFRPL